MKGRKEKKIKKETDSTNKVTKEDLKVLAIFLVNVIILIGLVGIIIYFVWGENGIAEKNKRKGAQQKLDNAVQAFANEEYENIVQAVEAVDGYEKIEETEEGVYNVTIDGYEMMLTQFETDPKLEEQ